MTALVSETPKKHLVEWDSFDELKSYEDLIARPAKDFSNGLCCSDHKLMIVSSFKLNVFSRRFGEGAQVYLPNNDT